MNKIKVQAHSINIIIDGSPGCGQEPLNWMQCIRVRYNLCNMRRMMSIYSTFISSDIFPFLKFLRTRNACAHGVCGFCWDDAIAHSSDDWMCAVCARVILRWQPPLRIQRSNVLIKLKCVNIHTLAVDVRVYAMHYYPRRCARPRNTIIVVIDIVKIYNI